MINTDEEKTMITILKEKIWRPLYWKFQIFIRRRPAINYWYRTFLIFATNGKCIISWDLKLDTTKQYDSLFKESAENFKNVVGPFTNEFTWRLPGRVANGYFDCLDAEVYYAFIRKYQPNLIIEIGSGNSTRFANLAVTKNGKGRIICIDPQPRTSLPKGVQYIQKKVEEVDLSVFQQLNQSDILFIDSSHYSDEALYHVQKILPKLKGGVILQHHDFIYPYIFNCEEEKVVMDFYAAQSKDFKIIFGNSWIRHYQYDLAKKLIPKFEWYFKDHPGRTAGSLWAMKVN